LFRFVTQIWKAGTKLAKSQESGNARFSQVKVTTISVVALIEIFAHRMNTIRLSPKTTQD